MVFPFPVPELVANIEGNWSDRDGALYEVRMTTGYPITANIEITHFGTEETPFIVRTVPGHEVLRIDHTRVFKFDVLKTSHRVAPRSTIGLVELIDNDHYRRAGHALWWGTNSQYVCNAIESLTGPVRQELWWQPSNRRTRLFPFKWTKLTSAYDIPEPLATRHVTVHGFPEPPAP